MRHCYGCTFASTVTCLLVWQSCYLCEFLEVSMCAPSDCVGSWNNQCSSMKNCSCLQLGQLIFQLQSKWQMLVCKGCDQVVVPTRKSSSFLSIYYHLIVTSNCYVLSWVMKKCLLNKKFSKNVWGPFKNPRESLLKSWCKIDREK